MVEALVTDTASTGGNHKAQRMEEDKDNRSPALKALVVMIQVYGFLPRELWDLARLHDVNGARGIIIDETLPPAVLERMTSQKRFSIVSIRTSTLSFGEGKEMRLPLPPGLLRLSFGEYFNRMVLFPTSLLDLTLGKAFHHLLRLPDGLQSLTFHEDSVYNFNLNLPAGLKRLTLGRFFSQPLSLPPALEEFSTPQNSAFSQPLELPSTLKKLQLLGAYRSPLNLHAGLQQIALGDSYNIPVALPEGLKTAVFNYTGEKLDGPPVDDEEEDEPVIPAQVLPSSLEKLTWTCPFEVILPNTLTELTWRRSRLMPGYDPFEQPPFYIPPPPPAVLPPCLRKLVWDVDANLTTPASLQELVIGSQFRRKVVVNKALKKITFHEKYLHQLALPQECVVVGPLPNRRVVLV